MGSVNDYHVFTADFGDNLLPAQPAPADVEPVVDSLAGGFSVPARVANASIDAVVRSTAAAQLLTKCSWLCTGFPVGSCECYWDTTGKEWACGKPTSITTGTCIGWCPG